MSTNIPQVPKNDYEELKCKYCVKVIGWANAFVINGLKAG
jgi:hypothetical protein